MPDTAADVADLTALDAGAFLRWAAVARSAFAAARTEIDALNVFPVPDGDTGTNLYLTLDSALDGTRAALIERPRAEQRTLSVICAQTSRAMLLTARGNSGVILSQLFRGLADYVIDSDATELDAAGLAAALARADDRAWQAVTEPKEGTILSVSRAAAAAAATAVAQGEATLATVITAALSGAQDALDRTPLQLPVLARAGVVDAGGAGYVVLFESLAKVVLGQDHGIAATRSFHGLAPTDDPFHRRSTWTRPVADGAHPAVRPDDGPLAAGDGPAYEVMFLLSDSDEARVATLRSALAALGDSLLVVGGEGTWNVHVHVDDPGAAVEAGIAAGKPHRIVITHFATQHSSVGVTAPDPAAVAVVSCAPGEGLAEVFRAAGSSVVLSGPGARASAGQILDAVRRTRAGRIIILPNDSDTRMAADAAARAAIEDGREVLVVPTRAAVHGVGALAVFDPQLSLEDNAAAMSRVVAGMRDGAVTVASREALTPVGLCHAGDILGFVDGEVAIIGDDVHDVAGQVVERLISDEGELLTLVTGAGAPRDLATQVAAAARIRHHELEVTHIRGDQPLYPLLLGIE
ncbi:MAG: DAK2 domain-containing protein [Dermatophilaceae bacterium]